MPALDSPTPTGSPLAPGASKEEALDYYKKQYEILEGELADFQQSSRELEQELEKDVVAAETRERHLKEKVEALTFETEEWKGKHKQSKTDANSAQNKLQKEITELRDQNRSLNLKLRDMEVANDDFERMARNTTSSLEDAESKYNSALERSVILEGEVKNGEQEREALRIEAQRLREELSDLKVEAEIRSGKLRLAEKAAEEARNALHAVSEGIARPESSVSERSPVTSESSPGMATPPAKSVSSATSEDPTIPSPMRADKAAQAPAAASKSRPSISNVTPRPGQYSRPPRAARTSIPGPGGSLATPAARRTNLGKSDPNGPHSSLSQVRGLIHKMQKLEARVQNARSKLPAPTNTPPRASPRPASSLSSSYLTNNVTVRSSRKRSIATTSTLSAALQTPTESTDANSAPTPSAGRERPGSRISYGQSAGLTSGYGNFGTVRPSSRQSLTSRQSLSNLPSATSSSRPSSRQSMSGTKTPLGDARGIARPRSSAAGTYSAMHGSRQSISQLSNYGMEESPESQAGGLNGDDATTPTPARRQSGIPAPSKRASLGNLGRRTSDGPTKPGDMAPPARKKMMSGIGETY